MCHEYSLCWLGLPKFGIVFCRESERIVARPNKTRCLLLEVNGKRLRQKKFWEGMKRYARAKTKGPCEQICPREVKNGSILLTFTSSSSVLWTKSRMWIRFRHKTLSGRERRGESSVGNLARGKENKRKSKNSRAHWKEWKYWADF